MSSCSITPAKEKKSGLTLAVPSTAAENKISSWWARANTCSVCPRNTAEDRSLGSPPPVLLSRADNLSRLSWGRGLTCDVWRSLTRPLTVAVFCLEVSLEGARCPIFPLSTCDRSVPVLFWLFLRAQGKASEFRPTCIVLFAGADEAPPSWVLEVRRPLTTQGSAGAVVGSLRLWLSGVLICSVEK